MEDGGAGQAGKGAGENETGIKSSEMITNLIKIPNFQLCWHGIQIFFKIRKILERISQEGQSK